jgi:hypothetical protein
MSDVPNEVGAADAGFSPSLFQDLRPGPADLFGSTTVRAATRGSGAPAGALQTSPGEAERRPGLRTRNEALSFFQIRIGAPARANPNLKKGELGCGVVLPRAAAAAALPRAGMPLPLSGRRKSGANWPSTSRSRSANQPLQAMLGFAFLFFLAQVPSAAELSR